MYAGWKYSSDRLHRFDFSQVKRKSSCLTRSDSISGRGGQIDPVNQLLSQCGSTEGCESKSHSGWGAPVGLSHKPLIHLPVTTTAAVHHLRSATLAPPLAACRHFGGEQLPLQVKWWRPAESETRVGLYLLAACWFLITGLKTV